MNTEFAENTTCQILMGSSLISGRRWWYIGLEMKEPAINMNRQQLAYARKGWLDPKVPFVGTEKELDLHIEKLVEECTKNGVPLKEVHVAPISLAR